MTSLRHMEMPFQVGTARRAAERPSSSNRDRPPRLALRQPGSCQAVTVASMTRWPGCPGHDPVPAATWTCSVTGTQAGSPVSPTRPGGPRVWPCPVTGSNHSERTVASPVVGASTCTAQWLVTLRPREEPDSDGLRVWLQVEVKPVSLSVTAGPGKSSSCHCSATLNVPGQALAAAHWQSLAASANWGAIMSYYFNFPLLCILIQYYVILCQYYFTYFIYSFWTIMSYYVTFLKSAIISIMSVVLFQLFYFVLLYILWQWYYY
jgi:hypothetical protein